MRTVSVGEDKKFLTVRDGQGRRLHSNVNVPDATEVYT